MKKLLIIGSSLVALTIFALGGSIPDSRNTAAVSNAIPKKLEPVSERIPTPDQAQNESSQEVSAQTETLLVNGGTDLASANSIVIPSDVVDHTNSSSDSSDFVALSTPAALSSSVSALRSAETAELSASAPTRVASYGPNGTHWPDNIPTPFMYDTSVPNIIEIDPTWEALSAAIQSVTDQQANEGTLILIKSGTVENPVVMRGFGNGSGSNPVLAEIGSEIRNSDFPNRARTKRITVAPSNGYGTLRWEGGVHIRRVKGVAFAGIITDQGIKSRGNTQSAFAWIKAESGQSGFYGHDGQNTYGMEIVEYVVPEMQNKSDDTADVYSVDGVIKDFDVVGSYFAPRFWLYSDCTSVDCPHTDTFQYATGGGGSYQDMTISDSVFFASNNSVIQTGNLIGMDIDHSFVVGGNESFKRYPITGGNNVSREGNFSAFNGSGRDFTMTDSFVFGEIKLNTTDGPKKWSRITNTKIAQQSGKYNGSLNDPESGDWTYEPGMTMESAGLPAKPTDSYLLSIWGKDVAPRAAAPAFSPEATTHNDSVTVTLSSSTAGAAIYYTTDGSNPTTSSTRYVGPFTLSQTATVKAIATASGLDNSFVQTRTYTVVQPGMPVITSQPIAQSAPVGSSVTFTVEATGNPAISGYQWKKNGSNISGATSASYTTPSLSASDSGSVFTVVVTNARGSVESTGATVVVADMTSDNSYQERTISPQTGSFTYRFSVTPLAASMNAVTGLTGKSSTVNSYDDFSMMVRMYNGRFDARNGGTYAYGRDIPFVAGRTYQVEFVVNTSTKKYDVLIDGTLIADDFGFRNTNYTTLNKIAYRAEEGSHTIGLGSTGGGGDTVAPVVNAGPDQTITLPTNSVTLNADVTDNQPVANLMNTWTKRSGTGTVTFGNENSIDTTATFSAAGTYVLRLSSNDGDNTGFDEITIVVNPQVGVNQAPVVSAGSDASIVVGGTASLDGTVSDDGLPTGSTVTQVWSRVDGPGTVNFASPTAQDTTATFSTAGIYTLRLTATDGTLQATDDVVVSVGGGTGSVVVTGEAKQWHKITLTMDGPNTSEGASTNPFKDYRVDVTFTHPSSGTTYIVPGYYAADGNAAESSASAGNKWRANFAPDRTGTWNYSISFRTGTNVAIASSRTAGTSAAYFDGSTGSFSVGATDKSGKDLRGKGRLVYDGEHYLKFAGTGERFIKAGVDSPENLLAYEDFDGTTRVGSGQIKSYSSHAGDYNSSDPEWQSNKGTELIGAINYLSNQGLNSISFLTFNVDGDDGNVYPFTGESVEDRFDVSKLDQWGIVFDHANAKGMYLHFKLMEAENDGNLTTDQFKLYTRELIARYGHELALNWNLGEENGQSAAVMTTWAQYLKDVDPYQHNRVTHLLCGEWPGCTDKYFGMMGNNSQLTGFSLQGTDSSDFQNTFAHVKAFVDESASQGKKWVVAMDEPGDASNGVKADAASSNNQDIARKHALWGTIMAGGAGVEWYFGSSDDIGLQNFRTRNNFYAYSKYAVDFLTSNGLPVAGLTNQNGLISGGSSTGNKVLAKTGEAYLVQLINGGSATLNLSGTTGTYTVTWLNPRTGAVTEGSTVNASASVPLNATDSNDWIVLLKRGGTPPVNQRPVANAGADQTVSLSAGATLSGSATDDGLPAGSSLSYAWTRVSGPTTFSFANASAQNTAVTFTAAGTYVFQLSASDGLLAGTDQVTITVTSAPATGVYQEAGGVVVMEAENTTSSLVDNTTSTNFWAVRTPGDSRYVASATNNAHLEYRSNTLIDSTAPSSDNDADAPLTYTFKINDGGFYQLHIRSHKNLENASSTDQNNDAYVKMTGVNGATITASPDAGSSNKKDASLTMLQNYNKIAGGSSSTWAWADLLDAGGNNNKRWPVYGLQSGGTYTFTMAGRSRGFAPDRIVLRKIDEVPMPLAKLYTIPESSKVEGGIDPNITPIAFGSTRVRTHEQVNVRETPSIVGNLISAVPFGSTGTIIGGPQPYTHTDGIKYVFWQVDMDTLATNGWTGGDNIEVIPGGSTSNLAPVVSAGADLTVALSGTATLDATASDDGLPAGSSLSYTWSRTSGPGTVNFANPSAVDTTATFSAAGTYVLQLSVTDGQLTTTDTATVVVNGGGSNVAPVVSAGDDVSVTLPTTTATLTGTATDSDGTIASRAWTRVSGPNTPTMSGQTTNTLQLSGLAQGTYTFRFTATDDDNATSSDDVLVNVASVSTGPIVYVRDGATGDGSSWSSALDNLPASANLVRGTTYYIADGSYGSYSFSKAESGTTMINFKKATAADHGSDTGWSASYGDGRAEFTNFEVRDTGYFVLDGGSRTGDKFETKGILIKTQTRNEPMYIVRSNDVRVSNVEIDANFDQTKTCQIFPTKDSSNITYTRNYMHDAGDDGAEVWDVSNFVFEDNEVAYLHGYSNEDPWSASDGCANGHSDALEMKTVNTALINRNYFHDVGNTSAFLPNNWISDDERNYTVTNNIFHSPLSSVAAHFNNMANAQVFNNTFLQARFTGIKFQPENGRATHDVTNFNMYNNIVSSMSIKDQFSSGTTWDAELHMDNNLIIGQEREGLATYVPNTNDINLNWKENKPFPTDLFEGDDLNELYYSGRHHPNGAPDPEDFTPVATNPGINRGKTGLPTSVTVAGVSYDISRDFFGNERTGTPDMGAIEYQGSVASGNPLLIGVWGSGTVTGTGISCGDDCREVFTSTQSVTLTAAPAAGATFRGWGGACTGTTATCTISVSKATAVTAKFEGVPAPEDYAPGTRVRLMQQDTNIRNLLSSGRPSTGGSLVKSFTFGEVYNLTNGQLRDVTATIVDGPLEGSDLLWYKFQFDAPYANVVGWSGLEPYDVIGATVNRNLTVTKTGNGTVTSSPAGIDCGTDCSNQYADGTVVTLTAQPATGATFRGWSGACSGTGTCQVTMSQARSVSAEFSTGGGEDEDAPSVPQNLTSTGVSATTASLSWAASTDNVGVTGYAILQNGSVIGNSDTTTFTAQGLSMNTTYSFSVRAFDAAGNNSAASNPVSVTTSNIVDVEAPTAPTGLARVSVTSSSATITWIPSDDNVGVASYEIFRGSTSVGSVAGNVATFTNTGLAKNTTYTYTVKAKDAANNTSAASAPLSVTTTDTIVPERIPSFGPNGSHWFTKIPTPFIYDDSVASIEVEPTWSAIQTALDNVTDAQANAGFRILVKPGVMTGSGIGSTKMIKDTGSPNWTQRVLVAPRDGFGTVTWRRGVVISDVQGVAFAGFIVEEPGISFKGNNRSALGWIYVNDDPDFTPSDKKVQIKVAASTRDVRDMEFVEVVMPFPVASPDDTFKLQASGSNNSKIEAVTIAGSYFAPRFDDGTGHTDTVQFDTGNYQDQDETVILDTAIFGSSNAALQVGSLHGLSLDHSFLLSGDATMSRYPMLTGGEWPDTYSVFNGGATGMNIKDSYVVTSCTRINGPEKCAGMGSADWNSVVNTKTSRYPGDTAAPGWILDTSMNNWRDNVAGYQDEIPNPTYDYLMSIWSRDGERPVYHTLTSSVTGSGSITGMTGDSQQFLANTNVVLTATPATGAVFQGWGGACASRGTNPTCTVTMDGAKSVSASFSTVIVTRHLLTVNKVGTGNGNVTSVPAMTGTSQEFDAGTEVQLTAAATSGSTFAGWSGACSGTGTCTVVMDAAKTVTATFNTSGTSYSITINRSGTGFGTVAKSPDQASYTSGTQVTLTATPNATSTFASWGNACTGSSPTCTLTMNANKTVSATFNARPLDQVATPTFVPGSTASNNPIAVTISTVTPDASIRYTTNGATPTTSSTLYTGPITVSSNATVKAIAIKTGMTNSAVGEATYVIGDTGGAGPFTSSGSHQSKSFLELSGTANRTGIFTVRYNVTPLDNGLDVVTGLTDGAPDGFNDYAAAVRFNDSDFIDVRNGGTYDVDNQQIDYVPNQTYGVRMEVDVPNRRYSVWVTVNGVERQIAQNYAFRSGTGVTQVTKLTHFGYVAVKGSHRMTNVVIGSDAGTPDTQAPSVPSGLSSSSVTSSSITLSWSASTDNVGVTGYEVLRGTSAGSLASIANVTGTTHVDSGLSANTTYYYAVRAKDAANNVSAASSVHSRQTNNTADVQAPSVPQNVRTSRETTTTVLVEWNASTDNVSVAHYNIYRNGAFVAESLYPAYDDSGLTPNTLYSYRVSAVDGAGNESSQSAVATMRTRNDRDEIAPTIRSFVAPSTAESLTFPVSLGASDDSGMVEYYISEGANVPDGPVTPWSATAPTSYTIRGGLGSGRYTIYAWAKDPSGNISAPVSQTVNVNLPDTTLPEVAITSPNPNALISGSAVAITAVATDNVAVTTVQFRIGNTLIANDTQVPYATTLNTTTFPEGAYNLTAIARDAAGNTRTSLPVPVIIGTIQPSDSDQDGVPDLTDRCPNTPQQFRNNVNRFGCPKPRANNFDLTTDFDDVDLSAVQNLQIGISNVGKIEYPNQTINLVQNSGNAQFDIDTHVDIDPGRVSVDSSRVPELNKPATITLYNITTPNPVIMKDGQVCTNCVILSHVNGVLVFTVQGFSTYTIVGDSQSPTVPNGLSSSDVTSSRVTLSWNASIDNVGVTGYEVYRGSSLVTTTSLRTYTDSGLSADTSYDYTVRARDAAGNRSAASSVHTVKTSKSSSGGGSSGGGGGGSSTKSLRVSCTISDTSVAPGSVITVGATVSGGKSPYTYSWTKDASEIPGFVTSIQSQSVRMGEKGTYSLSVKVTDSSRMTATDSCSRITVNERYNTTSGSVGPTTGSAGSSAGSGAGSTGSTGSPVSTGGSSYAFSRDLTIGSTGEDVRQLQKFLNARGFTVSAAGAGSVGNESTYFGPATTAALARYQAANAISPAAGYFGPLTRTRVNGGAGTSVPSVPVVPAVTVPSVTPPVVTTPVVTAPSTGTTSVYLGKNLAPGVTDADVLILQKFLNKYGFTIAASGSGAPGNEGTYYGELTKQAVKRFQASKGIPSDGWTYERTRAAINAMGASI